MFRTHTCGELTEAHIGSTVTLSGWVNKRRNLGGLVFVDLRDRYGITQVIFDPAAVADFSIADGLKYEYIVKVTGTVVARDDKNKNTAMTTGSIELRAKDVEVLSEAKTLPFEIFESEKGEEDEELRLKYRYLELRRERLKDNIIFRNKMIQYIHGYMQQRNFLDIATPLLTVSSPEGARDFLVPSRIHPGKFYALPQAPQQYKQLLMVAGFDRYYQIAPCMRDEDPRADRSPGEFYQLDTETSFLTSREFHDLMEPLFIELTENLAGKTVKEKPFPRIAYADAIETYGSDRPDLRFDLPMKNITSWAMGTDFTVFTNADTVRALAIPGGHTLSRKDIDGVFTSAAKVHGAGGLPWIKYEGGVCDGGITKFFTPEQLTELLALVNLSIDGIILFGADTKEVSAKALGAVRDLAGKHFNLADPNEIAWAWIVDFPMYEWDDKNKKIDFAHNPFSMPKGGMAALETQDPLTILADQYDIIANGLELSSGAVRNKDPRIMYKAFELAGYTKDQVNAKFGHMIDAFEYGAPPHCGFAPGIERLVMLLRGEKNIRAVVAFPKNGRAEEPMMGSPATVDSAQLRELGISLIDTPAS